MSQQCPPLTREVVSNLFSRHGESKDPDCPGSLKHQERKRTAGLAPPEGVSVPGLSDTLRAKTGYANAICDWVKSEEVAHTSVSVATL